MREVVVPKGWKSKNLIDVIEPLQNGKRPKGGAKGITEGIPSLGGEHLNYNGKFNIGNIKFVPTEFFKKQTRGIIKLNDILVVKDGATTGKTSFVDETFPYTQACVNEHVFILRTNGLIISKYLFYYIRSNFAQKKILEKTNGAIGGINTKFVKDFPIIFPENKEIQKQIVTKLDHIIGELEVKKNQILSLIEQNKERIDFFEKNWMSYVIDREIENHLQRNKWNIVKLESISELITKGSSPKWQGIQYTEHGILFITSENIGNGKLKIQKKKYVETKFNEIQKHSILKRGDLLTNIVGAGIGKSTLFDLDESANINQAVALIRLNKDIEKKFILNVLQSSQIIQFMHGKKVESARPNLSLTQVRNFPIPLPPTDIQKQIIQNIKNAEEKFKIQKKQFENIKQNYELKIQYINHIQSSVLDSAFSGKLVN